VQVAGFERVYAIADEDLERATEDKTSSVHFLRFDLTPAMVTAVKQGAVIVMGIEHEAYTTRSAPCRKTCAARWPATSPEIGARAAGHKKARVCGFSLPVKSLR